MTTTIPFPPRARCTRAKVGSSSDIADFDAEFFGIAGQEACWMDPQHRLLLETSWHALEDAGISPHPLQDTNVGVFIGIMSQDYNQLHITDDVDVIDSFQGAGLSHSAGVGRLSYLFGFEGPSVAIDTASSSSLVAVSQAAKSLLRRRLQYGLGRRGQRDSDSGQLAAVVQSKDAVSRWTLQIFLGRCRRIWTWRRLWCGRAEAIERCGT